MAPNPIVRGLRSRRIITPKGEIDGCVLISDGKIVSVVSEPDHLEHVVDVGEHAVLPGLVDSHVHINEPGRTEWEGFATATRAAAAGGVTTIVDMPLNSSPVTTSETSLRKKRSAARGQIWVNCGFYGGLTPESTSNLDALLYSGVLGMKTFLIDSGIDEFPPITRSVLENVMPKIAEAGLPLLVHAELQAPGEKIPVTDRMSAREFAATRPESWEENAIRMLVELSDRYRCRVHIVHLASARCLQPIREARQRGSLVTAETCPHYLYFDSDRITDGDTLLKCAPPIRSRENANGLWHGLVDGPIDFVVSDHSPCPPALKCLESGDFVDAWGGIASLQLGLRVVWTLAKKRGESLAQVSEWMSHQPAKLLGLQSTKGSIAPGKDADLIVFDTSAERIVKPQELFTRHRLSPYAGETLSGEVKNVFLGGRLIYENFRHVGRPIGREIVKG